GDLEDRRVGALSDGDQVHEYDLAVRCPIAVVGEDEIEVVALDADLGLVGREVQDVGLARTAWISTLSPGAGRAMTTAAPGWPVALAAVPGARPAPPSCRASLLSGACCCRCSVTAVSPSVCCSCPIRRCGQRNPPVAPERRSPVRSICLVVLGKPPRTKRRPLTL